MGRPDPGTALAGALALCCLVKLAIIGGVFGTAGGGLSGSPFLLLGGFALLLVAAGALVARRLARSHRREARVDQEKVHAS